MSGPRPKQSGFEGGRRPWNIPTEPAQKVGPPVDMAELETCLACTRAQSECFGNCFHRKVPGTTREVPEDFRERYLRGGGIQALARHYHASQSTVMSWRDQLGLPVHKRKAAPMPKGFREYVQAGYNNNQLRQVYQCSWEKIRRWRKEAEKEAAHGEDAP